MAYAQDLLALQAVDSELDQLARSIENPPERAPYDDARKAVASTETALRAVADQRAAAEREVAETEAATAEVDRQTQRLEQQLRNVVVVREAEALQHEIATLSQRRSDLDDVGLAALELLESLDSQQSELEARVPVERERLAEATEALEAVRAQLRQRQAEQAERRQQMASLLPAALLSRYETLRQRLGGVGAAALEGARCSGCRLDLARGELEEVRSAPPDELVDCPNCGRLLVR